MSRVASRTSVACPRDVMRYKSRRGMQNAEGKSKKENFMGLFALFYKLKKKNMFSPKRTRGTTKCGIYGLRISFPHLWQI